jgi:hypothetical protein
VLPSAPPPDVVVQCQWPVRESNPPRRLERAASCTDRRTGRVVCCCSRGELCAHRVRRVGREALESSSAVLQTAARPSQLPAQSSRARWPLRLASRSAMAKEKGPASLRRRALGLIKESDQASSSPILVARRRVTRPFTRPLGKCCGARQRRQRNAYEFWSGVHHLDHLEHHIIRYGGAKSFVHTRRRCSFG